jgi:hypothetical protein
MQLEWGARTSSSAAFGVSPKASAPLYTSPKGESFWPRSQSAGRRLEATGTVAVPQPTASFRHLFEMIMRRYENRSTIMTLNRPLEEWGKLLGDVPTAGAILDRFLHHAQTIAITGQSYRLKDHAAIAGKEDKNKKAKSKPNEPSTAEPAS